MLDVDNILFDSYSVNLSNICDIVKNALHKSDGGELFLELCQSETVSIENGIIKNADFNVRKGFGLRSFYDSITSFVCSSEISEVEIKKAADIVNSMGFNSTGNNRVILKKPSLMLYSNVNPIDEMSFDDKVTVLQSVDAYLRGKNQYVKQVKASISTQWQVVQIIRQDGYRVSDIRPLVRFNVFVLLEKDNRKEYGSAGHGGRSSCIDFVIEKKWKEVADEALRQSLVNLEAIPSPAGEMVVVLGPGFPGVLLHEAVGHGLEGDFNRKKVSAFSNSIGKQVAAKGITVVDNGTIEKLRGSINIDDEGNPSRYNVLIEDGILLSYMQDNMNAKLMGTTSTGNGRRQNYQSVIMPRMTNTYMLSGNYDADEIIASVTKGLYAVNFGGGQVDITSGQFVFSASESYLIENGKITYPVKGATLIGSGPDVLTKVSMVGNDLKLDPGVGTCSKNGQDIPVGVGQPTVKIDLITVGGTEV
ncbi:metalloprotease TldD [Neoehrlichia mikurensis]|uniref:Metalloprotease TldD n=1 Tax=Neoehrlichia mikurensis TaxID=89586 RepID=A0A9Q9C0U9_9RICK|nr:metalloprotease TldD [Neoehrlichia mikurensis]QXK92375.1 metalloprotease TldD [Neoehrlichia mikurensis]QXK93221.1 metalloprotease TldD [Neoehrlichia mikurensis]QXK94069.1 metalloprotease TldD [Neoehrlichia mikurensis]UTO55944.1 metalloprotease TldD [Neoehrlichia mikurensis]UTO56860.1 metalloprotease TldD [Neoehrlichia mikurensis]